MGQRLKGKILLQVEQNGEAWYVNPADEKRYFMGRPEDAFSLMRELGVGISNSDLKKIEIAQENMEGEDSDGDGLSDSFEDAIGTDKRKLDSDDDGFSDKAELMNGFNPKGVGKQLLLKILLVNNQVKFYFKWRKMERLGMLIPVIINGII